MFGWLDLADRVPKMFATADEDGIAKIIRKRAKKRLGVVSKPDGFQGKILWSLRSEDHGGLSGDHP